MASLYEINNEIEQALNDLLASADQETGEVDENLVTALADLKMQREEKLDNIGAYIKNLAAEAAMLEAEEKALKERREAKERKIESLKTYLGDALNGEKFESARVFCSWRKSESVSIQDENLIPKSFMVKKVTYSPDKKAIKEAIKNGKKVKGAVIETKNNLQIK